MRALVTRRAIINFTWVVGLFLVIIFSHQVYTHYVSSERAGPMTIKALDLQQYQKIEGIIDIQFWVNADGVKVYFVAAPQLPMVDIDVVLDAGTARNSDERPLSYLANALLGQGSKNYSADIIAEKFEAVGAQFSAGTHQDMATIHLRSLTDENALEPALSLFAEVIAHPSYDEESVSREKQNTITSLKYEAQKPSSIMRRTFYEVLYANGPYGRWILGDEKSVAAVRGKDLLAFHQKFYVKENLFVVLVGDLTLEQANKISLQVITQLPNGEKPQPLAGAPASKAENKTIPFTSTQTHMILGMPVLTREDTDYFPLVVGNHILGGSSQNNRIFDTVRGEHGLAYSAYSHFVPMKVAGPFMVVCQTQNKNAKKAKEVIDVLINDFIEKGPTEQELTDAKKNILGGYALRFDSNESISGQLSYLAFYQLPLDYFNQYQVAVENVSLPEIQAAYQNKMSLDRMSWVIVGEAL
jgi:zinc protease